jgi:hypothetical protein
MRRALSSVADTVAMVEPSDEYETAAQALGDPLPMVAVEYVCHKLVETYTCRATAQVMCGRAGIEGHSKARGSNWLTVIASLMF